MPVRKEIEMRPLDEIHAHAKSAISNDELRNIIDCELNDFEYETTDIRLAIAADLICDAALEVVTRMSGKPAISKVVALGGETQLE